MHNAEGTDPGSGYVELSLTHPSRTDSRETPS